MTLYGPGIAFGAPSSGSVVLTRSAWPPPRPGPWAALPRAGPWAALPWAALPPGPWANDTQAVRMNARVSADFMRRSLARPAEAGHYDLGGRPAKAGRQE